MVTFKAGKLYRSISDRSFPNENGLRNTFFYNSGENIDNPSHLKDDVVMLVLELLYTQRYKKSMRVGMHEPITVYCWHMKVLIDDKIGYVSQWEDQWEEVTNI